MTHPAFTPACFILYVAQVAESVAFYQQLLAATPLEQSPNFAMFSLGDGRTLGLWARHDVQPAPTTLPGALELGVPVGDDTQVDRFHEQAVARGWVVLQAPTRMDFGYTTTVADPDGHRLRVFHPGEM